MVQNNIREILAPHRVIPVVTFHNITEVIPTVQMLLEKNISCIEITLRTPIALEASQLVKDEFGSDVCLGLGTVLHHSQIKDAIEIGVDFLVSPGLIAHLAKDLESSDIGFIPGVVTPSEIALGISHGWNTFKFFPANAFGGLKLLKTYQSLFPDIKFCPTGGIKEDNYRDYLSLPNVICVGGSWVI